MVDITWPMRRKGISWSTHRYTASSFRRGPYWTGAVTSTGNVPVVVVPHRSQQHVMARWSVFTKGWRVGRSWTWRTDVTVAFGSGVNEPTHHAHTVGDGPQYGRHGPTGSTSPRHDPVDPLMGVYFWASSCPAHWVWSNHRLKAVCCCYGWSC